MTLISSSTHRVLLLLLIFTLRISSITTTPLSNALLAQAGNPNNYSTLPMRYTGTINGININSTGTIQEILGEQAAKDPSFTIPSRAAPALAARHKGTLLCWPINTQPWEPVGTAALLEALNALWKAPGLTTIAARTCSRISCSHTAAIVFCNDNPHEISPTTSYLSTYAKDIYNSCQKHISGHWLAGGQNFDTDGYNIIVKKDLSCP